MDNRNNTKDGFVLILIAAVAFAYFSGKKRNHLETIEQKRRLERSCHHPQGKRRKTASCKT